MTAFIQRCYACGKSVPFRLDARCACGGALLVEYDTERVKAAWSAAPLAERETSMWRYRELLPVLDAANIVSLGEGWTPLLRMPVLESRLGLGKVWVKREEQNPTGSFKARGFAAAISILNEHGIRTAAVPSNGNAASAMAAYAARAGLKPVVLVPKDCPGIILEECRRYGAALFVVDGLIQDAGRIIEDGKAEQGWFNVGTLREPGRVEGKKTMGLEVAEQLGWRLPDVIVYPTGGGSGIIGLWKAFRELKAMGLISGPQPRLVSVQEAGCQPIADAMAKGGWQPDSGSGPHDGTAGADDSAAPVPSPTGLRVPEPPDGALLVDILRDSGGTALAVTRAEMDAAQREEGLLGISASPEGAAAMAGMLRLAGDGWIRPGESVIVFNTAHADKYLPWVPLEAPPLIRSYADIRSILNQTGA